MSKEGPNVGVSEQISSKHKIFHKRLNLFKKEFQTFIQKNLFLNDSIKILELLDTSEDVQNDLDVDLDEVPYGGHGTTAPATAVEDAGVLVVGNLLCTTCGVNFTSVYDQRNHFRLDWHRYNLKMKLNGLLTEPVKEEQFLDMIDGLSSSISASEDDDDSESESDAEDKSTSSEAANLDKLLKKKVNIKDPAEHSSINKSKKDSNYVNTTPKYFYENSDNGEVFSIYKVLLPLAEQSEDGDNSMINLIGPNLTSYLNSQLKLISIIMVSGGHFAAGIFNGSEILHHKTFHSYTVRKKQGKSQGSRDNQSNQPKSAGASLRRYNEASFAQHVQDLITKSPWTELLSQCQLLFIRAIGSNQSILFGGKGKTPLFKNKKEDKRIRTIPFITKRPTLKEVKRVHAELTTIFSYGNNKEEFLYKVQGNKRKEKEKSRESSPTKTKSKKSKKKKNALHIDRARSRSPKKREEIPNPSGDEIRGESDQSGDYSLQEELTEIDLVSTLQEYDDSLKNHEKKFNKKKKKPTLPQEIVQPTGVIGEIVEIIQKSNSTNSASASECDSKISPNVENTFISKIKDISSEDLNQIIDKNSSTILHLAASHDLLNFIWSLMASGCSPSVKNKLGKYPYNNASSKEGRVTFRRFMAEFPDKFDYAKSQIPGPLSTQDLERDAEKKKQQNRLKRDKEKQRKLEKQKLQEELDEKERYLKLSDREKRAMITEKRVRDELAQKNQEPSVFVRCFECACDITGKVPFNYGNNLFCTTKCLKEHRKKFPVPLSV